MGSTSVAGSESDFKKANQAATDSTVQKLIQELSNHRTCEGKHPQPDPTE
jgi:hypothetical protein